MSSPRRPLTGVVLALVTAAGFGVVPVLGEVAYDDGAEPLGIPEPEAVPA